MGEVVKFSNVDTEEVDTKDGIEEDLKELNHNDFHTLFISEDEGYKIIPAILRRNSTVNYQVPFSTREYEGKAEIDNEDTENGTDNLETNEDVNTMDDGYKQLINRLDQDAREREERYERRSNELEDRISSMFTESVEKIEKKLDAQEKLFETKFDHMDTKIDNMQKQVDEIHNRTRFYVNLIVPTIVAISVGVATIFFVN